MLFLQLLPVALSLLVLGAHFLRAGNLAFTAVAVGLAGVLLVRRPWAARVVQAALVLGAAEWVRTAVALGGERLREGEPVARLFAILGGVALFTVASLAAFRTARVRRWFGLARGAREPLPGPPGAE
jgi:hypothetical protein